MSCARFLFLSVAFICALSLKGVGQQETLTKKADSLLSHNPSAAQKFIGQALEKIDQDSESRKAMMLYNRKGRYFRQKGSHDSAKKAFNKALEIAKALDKPGAVADQRSELAYIYNLQNRYDSALILYDKVISYHKKNDNVKALGENLTSKGSALLGAERYDEAMETLFKAEKMLKKKDNPLYMASAYAYMATIQAEMGYDSLTIDYYNRAIKSYRKLEDSTEHLAKAYADLGVSYKKEKKYDSALFCYRRSKELALAAGLNQLVAQNLMNRANIYEIQQRYDKALESYNRSLELSQEENLPYGIFLNYANLGDFYMNRDKLDTAIHLLNKSLMIGERYHFNTLVDLYQSLYEAHKKRKNMTLALHFHEKMAAMRDSLTQAQNRREIMELQTRYGTQKKEAKIHQLQKEQQREKLMRAYLLIALGVVVVLSLLIVLWIRNKRNAAKKESLLLEKENQQHKDQQEKLNLEKQLQEETAERYRLDLEKKEQELVYQTLKQANIARVNQSVKEKLGPFATRLARKKDQEEFSRALQEIIHEVNRDPLSDFEQMFMQMHDGFYEKLLEVNPTFSRSELQMCALLRMNLPSKEMAALLNLAISTIDQRRHSIRNKLGLESNQSLISYLISI